MSSKLLFLIAFATLHSCKAISVEDVRTDIEATNFQLIYSWLIATGSEQYVSLSELFVDEFNINMDDKNSNSIDLLLEHKKSMKIFDADLITNIVEVSDEDDTIINAKGIYYFYDAQNMIIDVGKYETIWKLIDLTNPLYIVKSLSFFTDINDNNINKLYFSEHDMGMFWANYWDSLKDLNDENDEISINKLLSKFSIYYEQTFVDTKDTERVLFGRDQLLEWMDKEEMYGHDRITHQKFDYVMMYKLSPWQSVFEAVIVLDDRQTKEFIKERRWSVIMGYDVINRKFYRSQFFYDQNLFNKEVAQIRKRFPNARNKPQPHDEL